MGKQQNPPDGPPPAYPEQVHLDAGPVPQGSNAGASTGGPYNEYGGFNNPSNKPNQSHLDPRAAAGPNQYGTPAPGGYASPMPGGYASPAPGAYGAPPQGYYGGYPPQQQMYYGPPQGPYPPGPGYGPNPYYGGGDRGYYDRRNQHNEGICAALMATMACCCCFDLMMF